MSHQGREASLSRRKFLSAAVAGLGPVAMNLHRSVTQGAGSGKRFKVIDTHLHTFNTKLQGKNGIPSYYPDATIEEELSIMDRGGVDKAFLITYNAEDVASEMRFKGESPLKLLSVANHEYQVNAWRAHKDRFWWFTDGVNPMHEDFLEKLDRDFELGASGVKLLPMFHGLLPDNPAWLPVFELCLKRRKPMILDWSWWSAFGCQQCFGYIGAGYNETKERQELYKSYKSFADWVKPMDPIFDRFSALPISLAHVGTPRGKEDYEHIFAFIARHPNCSCDLANRDYSPSFIERLVKAVGARRVMYGSDAPYWFIGGRYDEGGLRIKTGSGLDSYRVGNMRWSVIADECPFLSDEEKQLILAGNAERFVRNEIP